MITLVPSWARHYDAFWDAIQRRNFWLIKLRYGAVAMLILFLSVAEFILGAAYSPAQIKTFIIITFSILVYNIILQNTRNNLKYIPGKFNPLHFSLLQMLLDLAALWLLVYYTGSIESPLYMLFVFHMIIGSLILPGGVIYVLAFLVVAGFSSTVYLEFLRVIPHHAVVNLFNEPIYNNSHYVLAFTTVFIFVMFMSVILTNKIVQQLYKMEQHLVESLDKLAAAESDKQKYIMGIVHEIKSPLVALHSYLDIVLHKIIGPIDTKTEEILQRAKVRSDEAIQLTNNVLKISKLKLLDEVTLETIDLKATLCDIYQKLKVVIQTKNIKYNFSDDRTENKFINGDKHLIEIAFSNLVGNAVKYTEVNGSLEVKIKEQGQGVKVEIIDNGIGIPAKDIKNIFKDFYRASNIMDKTYEGSGLGLSIVKKIVERHGGNIEVESPSCIGTDRNPGTSFTITLPYNFEDKSE
jgi:signal transduction histidine kinase